MNDVYFKCVDCMEYIDAGYRWCAWNLEQTGIIQLEKKIDLDAVLGCKQYWDLDNESQWLRETLRNVRAFLEKHSAHSIVYTDLDLDFDNGEWLDLLPLCAPDNDALITPRYFAETLGFTKWEQVEEYVNSLSLSPPWWSDYDNMYEQAKTDFYSMPKSWKNQAI